jgi:C_GCAxxG_C_C family probable redox protein
MMQKEKFIQSKVKEYYWQEDVNCATTTLKVLSDHFGLKLSPQILDCAIGMHGAGEYGAQCGLVEGVLMFLGIYGREKKVPKDDIILYCNEFAKQFEKNFKSLQCSVLRPEGFHPDNPPHLCETLTCNTVQFSIEFISKLKV